MSRRIPLIAGGLVALIVIVWFVALWRPAGASIRAAQASELTALASQARLNTELASLISVQRRLPALETQLRAGVTAVPTSSSVDTVIDQINAVAVADAISWTNESQALSTTGSTTGGGATLALTLAVAGSYPDMERFITDLEHLPRLVVLDSLAFTPGARNDVAVAISARAFYNSTPLPKPPKP